MVFDVRLLLLFFSSAFDVNRIRCALRGARGLQAVEALPLNASGRGRVRGDTVHVRRVVGHGWVSIRSLKPTSKVGIK